MASDADTRRKARSDYVYRRMQIATVALTLNISQATIGRWKKAAKEAGDDWDMARSAATIAGEGLDTVVSSVTEDFVLLAQALLDEVKGIAVTRFTSRDVVRHPLVARIVDAYEQAEKDQA